MSQSFRKLGKGWGFPIKPVNGRLAYVEGPEKVHQAIRILLDTDPGERVMRPDLGCGLRRFLMSPNTAATRAQIQREVATTLALHEPRIQVDSVEVLPGDDPALVLITIAYTHLRDSRSDNFVYPFYLE